MVRPPDQVRLPLGSRYPPQRMLGQNVTEGEIAEIVFVICRHRQARIDFLRFHETHVFVDGRVHGQEGHISLTVRCG